MVKVKQYTKKVNGKTIKVNSYERKEPVLSAKEYLNQNKVKAPLKDDSAELSVQLSINIPSTKNEDEPLTTKEMDLRVQEVETYLADTFGGETSVKANGGYMIGSKIIQEPIVQVESSMSKKKYEELKPQLEDYIKIKLKEWGQHTIGYTFEDEFYLYPKSNAKEFMSKTDIDNY